MTSTPNVTAGQRADAVSSQLIPLAVHWSHCYQARKQLHEAAFLHVAQQSPSRNETKTVSLVMLKKTCLFQCFVSKDLCFNLCVPEIASIFTFWFRAVVWCGNQFSDHSHVLHVKFTVEFCAGKLTSLWKKVREKLLRTHHVCSNLSSSHESQRHCQDLQICTNAGVGIEGRRRDGEKRKWNTMSCRWDGCSGVASHQLLCFTAAALLFPLAWEMWVWS